MPHVTFIHGISNKPEEEHLKRIWMQALAKDQLGNRDGLNLPSMGITTSMIYWADVLYDVPLQEGTLESAGGFENNASVAEKQSDPDMAWRQTINEEDKKIVDSLAAKFSFDVLQNDDAVPPESEMAATLERIPLPWFLKRRLMKALLKDVHHYLFNYQFTPRTDVSYMVQEEIRSRVIKKLKQVNSDKHIVVSHSMGTIIMYDCLKRVLECPAIDGFMTIGSPLGIDEVQDKFAPEWSRNEGYPSKLKGAWVNVYDSLDPVTGFDWDMANDYKKGGVEIIEVINEQNWGSWRHDITKYLSGPKLRKALKQLLS